MKGFDINKKVKVKITSYGLKFLKEQHEKNEPNVPFTPSKVDENGYSTFQLWVLFSTFGEAFKHNMVSGPIYNLILFDEKDLVDL